LHRFRQLEIVDFNDIYILCYVQIPCLINNFKMFMKSDYDSHKVAVIWAVMGRSKIPPYCLDSIRANYSEIVDLFLK